MAERNFEDLAGMFRKLPGEIERSVSDALGMALDEGANHARQNHSYKDRTGALTNSIDSDGPAGEVGANDLKGTISAGAKYAKWVEKGTPAHEIRARYKKMLRFPVEGGFVFRHSVKHPGTQPMPFIEPAAEHARARLENDLMPDAIELAFAKAGFV